MTYLGPKTTCLVCGGSRLVFVGDDRGAFARPCLACRGAGSNPLRDCTRDDTDDALDALESANARLRAELDAVTVQRDWAMREMDAARERLERARLVIGRGFDCCGWCHCCDGNEGDGHRANCPVLFFFGPIH